MEQHYAVLDKKKGFIDEFYRMTQEYPTYELAYEAVERKYIRAFGKRKYKNYNSFRTIRDRK
jgi:hypothetical protein